MKKRRTKSQEALQVEYVIHFFKSTDLLALQAEITKYRQSNIHNRY